jgi:hypothetical protein
VSSWSAVVTHAFIPFPFGLDQRRLREGLSFFLFFFILKPIVMQYYILPSAVTNAADNQYTIMQVKPAEQAAFLSAHGHQVIAQGNSIAEALQQFNQWVIRQPAC